MLEGFPSIQGSSLCKQQCQSMRPSQGSTPCTEPLMKHRLQSILSKDRFIAKIGEFSHCSNV